MNCSYFGSPEAAIGKTIRYEDKETLRVTAVFENIPSHSSLWFDFLRSWTDFVKQNVWVNNWGNQSPSSFVQLPSGADPVVVGTKIKDFLDRYTQKIKGFRTELALQPYPEKYLHSTFKDGSPDGGRIEYVRLFTGVAIFILLIACINFMNLATAQSGKSGDPLHRLNDCKLSKYKGSIGKSRKEFKKRLIVRQTTTSPPEP